MCDKLYGGRSRLTAGELRKFCRDKRLAENHSDADVLLDRQALHAHRLCFSHPVSGEECQFEAPLPQDIEQVLFLLREFPAAG